MKRLLESRKVLASTATIPSPDAKIIFTKASFVQYEQLLLDKNFRQYLETIMVSTKMLRMGAQKTLNSLNIDFLASNSQFDWLELSLVYDKSDKYTTMYDSYNVEMAAKTIKSIKLSNSLKFTALQTKKNMT